MINKYLLLFVASFFSLNLIAAEVNIDRVHNEIQDGCSDEVIDWLRTTDGSEDILDELLNDTVISACIRFNEPKESLRLIKSVRKRLINLEIPEDADPNKVEWAYAQYIYFWFFRSFIFFHI